MKAIQTEKQLRRRTGMLPALAAMATLAPAVAGLALTTGRADAVRSGITFHCSNEHGNGATANPLDDNTDPGLDAGATARNTGGTACSTTTTTPLTSAPPTTIPATVDPTDPTVTTVPPAATSPTTSPSTSPTTGPTDPTVTTVTPPSPTVATIPQSAPFPAPPTAATTTAPPTTGPTTTEPGTTVPAVLRFVGPTTTIDGTAIPVEIAPNDGAIVNPATAAAARSGSTVTTRATAASVLAFTVSRPTPGDPTSTNPTSTNPATTNPAPAHPATTVTAPDADPVYIAEGTGSTPPPIEVLGISISRFSSFATASAPSGLADQLAFTGSPTGRLTSLAGAAMSIGLGLVTIVRRRRRQTV